MTAMDRQIMIVVGEASGDLHAAKLVKALQEADPAHRYRFFGSAGPHLRAAGTEAAVKADDLSVVGLLEIGRSLPMFLKARKRLLSAARDRCPDAVILVDFPDFNLKLSRSLKKMGLKVIYYISPQVWAWRKYRIASIRKYVDLLLTILPFEKDWFIEQGVTNVEYVGSPLAREVFANGSKHEFCSEYGLKPEKPIVALLPGSRQKEIARILPVMIGGAREVKRKSPDVQFIVAAASDATQKEISSHLDRLSGSEADMFKVVSDATYELLNAADAAAVTSGTATMEAGIIGTPLVIVYRTSRLNYMLLEPLISVEHYGLINLIAGERIATELIQDNFTPQTLANEITRLLEPDVNTQHREKLRAAAEKLGHGGASKRAAESIVAFISATRHP
jgi:lipid-A-disaccharide synthase